MYSYIRKRINIKRQAPFVGLKWGKEEMTQMQNEIVVIGGGPGGYAAAIKASQLGAKVTLVEREKVGGTCLNIGCIPTKALLHTGQFYRQAVENAVAGVNCSDVTIDWTAAQAHKEKIVSQLTGGVEALLRHNGVNLVKGTATLLSEKRVKIGEEIIKADAIVIATGSESTNLPVPGVELPGVMDSTGALSMTEIPASMVIVGGGVIGAEFASLYRSLGVEVTVLEMQPEILPSLDAEMGNMLRGIMESEGLSIRTGVRLKRIEKSIDALKVSFEENGQTKELSVQKVLMAVGRRPRTAGMGLEKLGVSMTRGAIDVDEGFTTNLKGIYAVGDCNGRIMLAHAAMAQGIAAVEHIMGITPGYNPQVVPSCVYSGPEIASVGMSEQQVQEAGIDYTVGRFSLSGNGKAMIEDVGGMIKIVAEKNLGEILGVHMIGPRVTEMIAEAALCMSIEGTVEDIVNTIHAHPTVGEAVCEAAMSVFGKPIHGI